VGEWIARTPESTVPHLGCGIDSRVYRVDPPASVRWFDVDYPEVVDLRRQVYSDRPAYRMIGASLLERGWLDEVPGDLPAMILAEGVMMYLPPDGAEALLASLVGHFPGGRLAFDALSKLAVRMAGVDKTVGATGATLGWGLDDPDHVKKSGPRLELIAELSTPKTAGHERLPLAIRAAAAMEPFPKLRRMNRLLLYRF